jgi:hypothetical protein
MRKKEFEEFGRARLQKGLDVLSEPAGLIPRHCVLKRMTLPSHGRRKDYSSAVFRRNSFRDRDRAQPCDYLLARWEPRPTAVLLIHAS